MSSSKPAQKSSSESDLASSQIRAQQQTKVFLGEGNDTKEEGQSVGDVQMQSLRVDDREAEERNKEGEKGMMDARGQTNSNKKGVQQALFEKANQRSEFALKERSPISLPSVENGDLLSPTPQNADLNNQNMSDEENMLSVLSPTVIRSRSEPYFVSEGGSKLAKTVRMSQFEAKYAPPPASSTNSTHHRRSKSFENYASKTTAVMNTASRRQPTVTVTARTSDGMKDGRYAPPPPLRGRSMMLENEENVENIHSFAIAMDAFQQQQQQEQENKNRSQPGGGRYSYGAVGSSAIPPALRDDNNMKNAAAASKVSSSSRSMRYSFLAAGNGKRSPALDEQTHLLASSSSAPINQTQSLNLTTSGMAYKRKSPHQNQEQRYSPNAAFDRSGAFVMTSPAFIENRSRQALQESNPNSEFAFTSNTLNTNSGNPIAETNERGEIIPVLKPIHRHFGNFHSPFYIDDDEIKKANVAAIAGKTKVRRGDTILPNKNPNITTFDELMWSGYGMDGAAMEDAQAELSRLMDKMAKKDLLKRAQAHFERLVDCTAKHTSGSESDLSFSHGGGGRNANNKNTTKAKGHKNPTVRSDSTWSGGKGDNGDGDYTEVRDPTRHFDDPYQYEQDEEEEESEEEEEAAEEETEEDRKEAAITTGSADEIDGAHRNAPKSDGNFDEFGNTNERPRSSPDARPRSQQQQQNRGPPRTRSKKNFFIANALKKALTGGRGASSPPRPETSHSNKGDKNSKKGGHFFGRAGGYLTSGKAACEYQDPAALQKEDKYPILIQTMALVGAALVLKYVLQTVYKFHGYISLGEIGMVFTGLFFIQGIVFGSATSDLKAAQALPGKVVVILEEMEDHFMYQSRKVLAKNLTLSYPQAIILHFADTWREYIMYQEENSYWHCELILREIVLLGALWDSKGANVGKVPELVGKLREPLSTAAFIHRSQYLPATYILLLFFVTTASILMFLVQFNSYTVMFGVTASVLTVIWFTLRLIKALENPFNVAAPKGFRKWLHGHMAAVQIFQLNEYIEKLDYRRRVQKRREKLMFTAQKDNVARATKKADEKDSVAAKMIAISNNAVASSSSVSSGGASPSQQQQSQKAQQSSNVSNKQAVSSAVRHSNAEAADDQNHSSTPPSAEHFVSIAANPITLVDKTGKEIIASERSAENPRQTLDEIVLGRSSRMSQCNINTPTTSVSGRPLGLGTGNESVSSGLKQRKKKSKNKSKKDEEKGQLSSSLQQETRAVANAAVALARWRRKVLDKSSSEGSTDSSSDSDDDEDYEEEDDLINLSYERQDSRDSSPNRFKSD